MPGGRPYLCAPGLVWTDLTNPDRIPVTAVAAFSAAYFALVRMLPGVISYLSAGEDVLVEKPGELAAVVRNFRGT